MEDYGEGYTNDKLEPMVIETIGESLSMETSDELGELLKSLIEAQKTIENVVPNQKGNNYMYADLANVIDGVKPSLIKNNLVIFQVVTGDIETRIIITTRLQHTSGQYIQGKLKLKKVDSKFMIHEQAMAAAITYARRYSISALLFISTEHDTDGYIGDQKNAQTQKEKKKKKVQKSFEGMHPKEVKKICDTMIKELEDTCKDSCETRKHGQVQANTKLAAINKKNPKMSDDQKTFIALQATKLLNSLYGMEA